MTQILTQSWLKTRQVLLTPGTWTLAVWNMGLLIVTALLILLSGGSAKLALADNTSSVLSGVMIGGSIIAVIGLLLWISILWVWIGGFFGGIAYVLNGCPITWRTFWVEGWQNRERTSKALGWLVAWAVVWAVILDAVADVSLPLGIIVAFAGAVITMPWVLHGVGALFVDHKARISVNDSMHVPHYGTLLIGTVATVAMGTILMFVRIGLAYIPVIGFLLNLALSVGFSVAVVVWWLALYQSAHNVPGMLTSEAPAAPVPITSPETPASEGPIISE